MNRQPFGRLRLKFTILGAILFLHLLGDRLHSSYPKKGRQCRPFFALIFALLHTLIADTVSILHRVSTLEFTEEGIYRMMETQKIPLTAFIPGGDGRMVHTAKRLEQAGCAVTLYGQGGDAPPSLPFERLISDARLIVLPVPVSRDGLTLNAPLAGRPIPLQEIASLLHPGQAVAGGGLPCCLQNAIRAKGCAAYDCLTDERFALPNALATAEGAIALAITETPDLLADSDCVILGYGRIARHLARLLTAMGARVTVFARKESARTEAKKAGYAACPLSDAPTGFACSKLIFNTIPARLFDFAQLLPPDAIVLDLAPIYAPSDSPRVIRAAALPAKYAPSFAGRLYGQCILSALIDSASPARKGASV